jgi:hypothetical protein
LPRERIDEVVQKHHPPPAIVGASLPDTLKDWPFQATQNVDYFRLIGVFLSEAVAISENFMAFRSNRH